MVSVRFKKIGPLCEREVGEILESLSVEARERLDKKREPSLRLASLCALSLIEPQLRARLRYSSSGRPYFEGASVRVSITHSRTLAAVALSDGGSVGVDAEDICATAEERERICRALGRFFGEGAMLGMPEEAWTRREALFKYLGGEGALVGAAMPSSDVRYSTCKVFGNVLTVCADEGEGVDWGDGSF